MTPLKHLYFGQQELNQDRRLWEYTQNPARRTSPPDQAGACLAHIHLITTALKGIIRDLLLSWGHMALRMQGTDSQSRVSVHSVAPASPSLLCAVQCWAKRSGTNQSTPLWGERSSVWMAGNNMEGLIEKNFQKRTWWVRGGLYTTGESCRKAGTQGGSFLFGQS